ncbi:hypothetical protein KR044_000647 [Drosophila immigrans]|nr:hypothetical protein KR044_000647 [Drosophila immigrans]
MESSIKLKESSSNSSQLQLCNGSAATAAGVTVSICSSDSFSSMMPPAVAAAARDHELVSANSIELNAAASLSDDSGVPLTTNSSISSGDSYRLGMCKFEIEMVESDGEVSQFDSLDNCSEGGMSAENFNTLKKGPLAPIDPPPEFQDSPQTTLVRSISKNIVNSLRRWTSSQSSFEHLKDDVTMVSAQSGNSQELVLLLGKPSCQESSQDVVAGSTQPALGNSNTQLLCGAERTLKEAYAVNKHLYSSDSILNSHTDNIYDEPNNIISSSLGNSIDLLDEDEDEEDEAEHSEQSSCSPSLPSPPPPVSIIKIKQTLCPYYQDHTRYFKAIPTEQDNIASAKAAAAQQRFNSAGLSEIHDYDLYYGARSRQQSQQQPQHQQQQQSQQTDNSSLQRRQLLYSPLGHTSHCHYHHHHQHYGHHHHHHHQRPNSRNSLNSRLSSSHNSLNVSSANKPDDSIFITQAMSHDALFTREISDFYNVPIDSDIYAFPVDMIEQQQQLLEKQQQLEKQKLELELAAVGKQPAYHKAASRRNKRNKRKQRYAAATTATETSDDGDKAGGGGGKHGKYRTPVTQSETEPLHMTLDEVKQFYHTLYSDAGKSSWCSGVAGAGGGAAAATGGKTKGGMGVKSSNETIWSVSTSATNTTNTTTTTARTRSSIGTTRTSGAGGGVGGGASSGESSAKYLSKQNKHNIDNDKLNNNNNNNINNINNASSNNYAQQQQQQTPAASSDKLHATSEQQQPNNKHVLHTEKKSQFSLNLKQKFCSIFRFRRSNHNRCRANATSATAATATATTVAASASSTAASSSLSSSATPATCAANATDAEEQRNETNADLRKKFQSRALPPLPKKGERVQCNQSYAIDAAETETEDPKKSNVAQEPRALQFTSSIEKVKDYGWYWGPLSSEAAEKVLSNEPDGSFIVRDSSDDHYIFSLSFKLNNCVRHVRIEQDQGTFSFGSYAKFKSQTITEFIEKAVEHSRSGRYLFFLHRRPEHGPMRVQLTNPVSRFKHVQSLQHMCRFVILKAVIRKDLIQTLPLPRRLLDYLNYKHCYSEQVESDSSHSQVSVASGGNRVGL